MPATVGLRNTPDGFAVIESHQDVLAAVSLAEIGDRRLIELTLDDGRQLAVAVSEIAYVIEKRNRVR